MAASAEKIESDVLNDLIAQSQARKVPSEDVLEDLQHQKRLREGDYDLNTLPGAGLAALGAVEVAAQWISGFASAVPGFIAGTQDLAVRSFMSGEWQLQEAPEAFAEQAEKTTWEPKSVKGKKIKNAIEGAYNEYIQEGWGEYLAEGVEQGYFSPAEAAYYRASADALMMGAMMKGGGAAAKLLRRSPKPKEPIVDLDEAPPLEGEYIPNVERAGVGRDVTGATVEGVIDRPKLTAPEETPLRIAVRKAIEDGRSKQEIEEAVRNTKSLEEAEDSINKMERPPVDEVKRNPLEVEELDESLPTPNEARAGAAKFAEQRLISGEASVSSDAAFKNRYGKQSGAIDIEVFREGVAQLMRPGVRGAKLAADVTHALARQIAFKHVTDIRKINSPTAKMLADRIMPSETSEIPLGGGFHELISLKTGEYGQRVENILEPLRKHVINKNATKTMRIIALPKRVNDAIFRALDTGKVPESLAPVVKALRAILDDMHKYQVEAGVDVGYESPYFGHMWNANKISRAEFGRKNGGAYTKYLMEKEGLSFEAAQRVISTITHEEGFLDFVDDIGGRLPPRGTQEQYNAWARAHRVGGGPSRPAHTQARKLKGNFDEAKEWLVTDVESVLTNYIRKAVEKAEYTRIAGPGEIKLNQMVRQIIEEQQISGEGGGKLKASSPHKTAQEIYDVFDAMQRRFHQIDTPSVRRASRALAGYEVMVHLSKVTLAQFPESMMPAARYRVATTTKGGKIPMPLKSYAKGMVDSAINAMSHASLAEQVFFGHLLLPSTVPTSIAFKPQEA